MWRSLGALGILCILLAGCASSQARMQMAEENEKERDLEITTIGDATEVGNAGPMKVQAVGLVTGLAGTGHCPNGYYRNLLEQYLLKSIGPRGGQIVNEEEDVKVRRILDDPSNALVIVTGYIPAGVRRGDHFDVEVSLPEGSKTTSLAGGYLELSMLRVYEAAANLSDRYAGSSTLLAGQILAHAKGPLIVGFGNQTDSNELKTGRVWLGGTSRLDRPYAFLMKMNEKDKSIRVSNTIAERINFMYQDNPHNKALLTEQQRNVILLGEVKDRLNTSRNAGGLLQAEMAKAVNKSAINVRVPFAYRHNHARYLLVSRQTPLLEGDPNLLRYQQRLRKMLLDPRDTLRACLRLEAMGRDSIGVLKEGLENEHALVRFASAEALAYLGSTAGVDTLTQVAWQHPIFAYHATLALANLGESVCRDKLAELLKSPEPVVRTSAFHALSLLDEEDPRLGGQYLDNTFWLYRMMQSPTPMVYFSTSKRAQVILFGRDIELASDTRLFVGKDFTIVTDKANPKSVLKRITTAGEEQRTCSLRVDEILVALVDLHASYPDVVDFLRKAHDYRKINCAVVHWTVPEVSLATLIEAGQGLR